MATSQSNVIGFSTSLGYYRNDKTRFLRAALLKTWKRTVPLYEQAPMLFQILLAYCAENKTKGDLSALKGHPEMFQEIFAVNHTHLSLKETEQCIDAMHDVGLLIGYKVPSWKKYQKHLAEHDKVKKDRKKAADKRWKEEREFEHLERQSQLKALKKGKPLTERDDHEPTLSEELRANRTQTFQRTTEATGNHTIELKSYEVEFQGKAWRITDLRAHVKEIEGMIAEQKKLKPAETYSVDSGGKQTLCEKARKWLTKLNDLEKLRTAALNALHRRNDPPTLTKPPKLVLPLPLPPEREPTPEDHAAAKKFSELAATL